MDCACHECVSRCRAYPGWMSPENAKAAIEAGMYGRLMLDWWEPDERLGNKERVFVLAPASAGAEGQLAPDTFDFVFGDNNECTFLTKDNRCEIHNSGYKPVQCVTTMACKNEGLDKIDIVRDWDTDAGREIVKLWRVETGN